MPNYTSNLNLYKWDKSDKKLDTITETASTMDKIDTALNNATNTANIAKTTADSATITANNAVTTANVSTTTANDAKTTANSVQSQFNQVVAEAGSNNPEVVQARSGEVNLNTRLDKLTTQLAEKPSYNEVRKDTMVQPILMVELSTEVKTAMTGGSVAVVGYDAVGYENVKKKGIHPDNTDFLNRKSYNLLNPNTIKVDTIISSSTGQESSLSGWSVSDFIEVEAGKTYIMSEQTGRAIYDANKNYLSGTETLTTTIPSGGKYVRVNFRNQTTGWYEMVVEGTTFPGFMPYSAKSTMENISVGKLNIELDAVEENKCDFLLEDTTNLLNSSTITDGLAIDDVTGGLKKYADWSVSDFIKVEAGKTYVMSQITNKAIYDKNKQFLSTDTATATITIPSNGRYIRVSIHTANKNNEMVVEGAVFPSTYIPYVSGKYRFSTSVNIPNVNRFYGKKANFLGDSITENGFAGVTNQYWELLVGLLGLNIVRGYGVASSTISSPPNAQSYQPMCDRYMNMDDDADLVTVFAGTNDWGYSDATKGSFYNQDGTINKDKTTFYGGCHVLFEGLVKKYANRETTIVVITPIPRINQETALNPTTGMKLSGYVSIIKEVAQYYSLPILDLYSISGINPNINEINTKYFVDGTHPNDTGHKVIANRLAGFVKTI